MLLVHPVAEKLKQKAASLSSSKEGEVGVQKEETVHYLVDRWATLNLGRSLLTGMAALLATWAAVERLAIREFRIMPSGVQRMEMS